ncbi:MAG: LysR family transcriptional regulator, partial [Myxococcota bacterium]
IGFAFLADWLTGPSLRAGELVSVLEPYTSTEESAVSIVTPTRLGRPARVQALLAAARRHFVPPPWTRVS